MTKPERIIQQLLESLGFNVKNHKSRSKLDDKNTFYTETPYGTKRLDFALIPHKLAIEANGDYWHATTNNTINSGQLKQKISDAEKKQMLITNGWSLLVISERSLSNFDKWRENLRVWILETIDL